MKEFDVIIIGAGAAGLMAASVCSETKKTLIIESNKSPGRKIIISGGGRCNFTNMEVSANHYLSKNIHFSKSALKQYTNWDFIGDVIANGIGYHEKTLGQLFCDNKSKDILDLLLKKVSKNVEMKLGTRVLDVEKEDDSYLVRTGTEIFKAKALIIASGGLSMPLMGASDIGYKIARSFGHKIVETAPALVPFTLAGDALEQCRTLSGVSIKSIVTVNGKEFYENILFTHKGLSGPAILKASLYWYPGDKVKINFIGKIDEHEFFKANARKTMSNALKEMLPSKFIEVWLGRSPIYSRKISEISKKELVDILEQLRNWTFVPSGTEGYRKAEVTRGGVSTDQVSSKTLESKLSPGLFFVGEVLDMTGLLGGYNFQWAWSSGYVAGKNV